jgi:Ni,Fe-hydrogenase III large subunit
VPHEEGLKIYCCIADDVRHQLHWFSYIIEDLKSASISSLTPSFNALHIFEREIHENYGVNFENHPWQKPVRFAHDRHDRNLLVKDYPFYKIESDQLHEVGVGPIHAGVIEPGHFRFICNGEMVLHLEIQLGWQHRGVEKLMLQKTKLLQRNVLTESIAGDTAIGHAWAFASAMEALNGIEISRRLLVERTIALEMERIAMHIFDMSNLCVGIAYQLGASVFGALRTPVINYFQAWCGNRFGKGLIRVGGTHYPFTQELADKLKKLLDTFSLQYEAMADRSLTLPSLLNRFEGIGTLTQKQVELIGAVGVAARMADLKRDVRWSHPIGAYHKFQPIMQKEGDVLARYTIRRLEITQSITLIRELMKELESLPIQKNPPIKDVDLKLKPSSTVTSLIEGWRGEIAHTIVTDAVGNVQHYKVKDPSFHNWTALALSLRNLEISDFPINNKSYDLSYCGHDL